MTAQPATAPDDALADKASAEIIEITRRQYEGTEVQVTPQFEAMTKKLSRQLTPRIRAKVEEGWDGKITAAIAASFANGQMSKAQEMDRATSELRNFNVREERKAYAHGYHKAAWQFGIPAFIIGGALVGLGITWSQAEVFERAIDAASTRDMTDAIIRQTRGAE